VVDKATLDQMLSNLRGYVRVLGSLAAFPREDFLGNPDKIGNTKYHFVIAIECCIDIANHIIASENYRFPRDNAESFAVLIEAGILAEDLREPLRNTPRRGFWANMPPATLRSRGRPWRLQGKAQAPGPPRGPCRV